MKSRLTRAAVFAAVVLSSGAVLAAIGASTQETGTRPDLVVRRLEVHGKGSITVWVLNRGKTAAPGCNLELSVIDAPGKSVLWTRRFAWVPVESGATGSQVYDIAPQALQAGMIVRAVIDITGRVTEEDETNNTRDLTVPAEALQPAAPPQPAVPLPAPSPPAPAATPAPAPAAAPPVKPLLSPDLAAVAIQFGEKFVVGVLKNVGDRDFHAKDAQIKDSFKRAVTLTRIVHIGAKSYSEDIGTRQMGDVAVGATFNHAFPVPKRVPGATQYTWVLTIQGADPNDTNNTFSKVQKVTKID